MSVQSALYYWLSCDGCGARSTDSSFDASAWSDVETARMDAQDGGWLLHDDDHWCNSCIIWCQECEDEMVPPGRFCTQCGWKRPATRTDSINAIA